MGEEHVVVARFEDGTVLSRRYEEKCLAVAWQARWRRALEREGHRVSVWVEPVVPLRERVRE